MPGVGRVLDQRIEKCNDLLLGEWRVGQRQLGKVIATRLADRGYSGGRCHVHDRQPWFSSG